MVRIKNIPAGEGTCGGHYHLYTEMTNLVQKKEKEAYDKGPELAVV